MLADKRSIGYFISFILVAVFSLHLRTAWIQNPGQESRTNAKQMASMLVLASVREQVKASVISENPGRDAREVDRIVSEQVEKVIQSDNRQFEEAIRNAETEIAARIQQTQKNRQQPFLLEADPYYYYYAVQKIEEEGSLFLNRKDGLFFNPLRLAPSGSWDWLTLHPYVGYFLHHFFKIWKPDQVMMESLGWVPILLSMIVAILFFQICRIMNFEALPALLGGFVLMTAPIFIQRSAFGWFDTDPYNYLFPLAVLMTLMLCIQTRFRGGFAGALGGFLTGLYALFWAGWPFLLVLVVIASGSIVFLECWRVKKLNWAPCFEYLIAYLFSSILFSFVFITPKSTIDVIYNGLVFIPKFSVSTFESWPSAFLTVGEAKSISLQKLIFLTGNYVIFGIALIGFIASGIYWYRRKKDNSRFYEWLVIALFALPLFVLSIKTERFSVLFALPLALLVAFGAEWLMRISAVLFGRAKDEKSKNFAPKAAALVLLLAVLPMGFVQANIVSRQISPIMDLVWYQALTEIRDQTPENAIVHSWWPPGYFIISVARRRALVDGGTQERPQSYWIAKAFLSSDESQSAGILRMLSTSGNEAMDFLQGKSMSLSDASNLILDIVKRPRSQAFDVLPNQFTKQEKLKLLDLTHGENPAPSYVLLYKDLIDQNLAVTLMSEWDFEKAKALETAKHTGKEKKTAQSNAENYIQNMLQVTGGVLKYWPQSEMRRQDGKVIYFQNGVSIDLESGDAKIQSPGAGPNGNLLSLFYLDEDALIEKESSEPSVDASVLLIRRNDVYACVVADRKLIRSMMFRWYYLDGKGLSLFNLFTKQDSEDGSNRVSVFQVNFESVLAAETEVKA